MGSSKITRSWVPDVPKRSERKERQAQLSAYTSLEVQRAHPGGIEDVTAVNP